MSIFFLFKNSKNISEIEKKESSDYFSINKIKYYSSCNAITNTTNYQNPEWNVKVYQYTDIAIYLDRLENISNENYITNIVLSNFKLLDNEKIYYLNPTLFGNNNLNNDDIVSDSLKYNVINSSNDNNEQNYNIPIFFQDCSNPITLRFLKTLSDNYNISNEDSLVYNGSLIEKLGINLNSLNTNLCFDLEIDTKDGSKHVQKIELNIPLENGDKSILDGDFEVEQKEDIKI